MFVEKEKKTKKNKKNIQRLHSFNLRFPKTQVKKQYNALSDKHASCYFQRPVVLKNMHQIYKHSRGGSTNEQLDSLRLNKSQMCKVLPYKVSLRPKSVLKLQKIQKKIKLNQKHFFSGCSNHIKTNLGIKVLRLPKKTKIDEDYIIEKISPGVFLRVLSPL